MENDFKFYLGIDTGLDGALALLDREGKCVWVKDMPTTSIERGGSKKRKYDLEAMCVMLRELSTLGVFVTIEETMPRSSYIGGNSYANWFLGGGYLCWVMVLIWAKYRFVTVAPQTWQKASFKTEAGKSKVNSLRVAKDLFPHELLYDRLLQGGPNKGMPVYRDGRCDALLIGEYGRREALGLDMVYVKPTDK